MTHRGYIPPDMTSAAFMDAAVRRDVPPWVGTVRRGIRFSLGAAAVTFGGTLCVALLGALGVMQIGPASLVDGAIAVFGFSLLAYGTRLLSVPFHGERPKAVRTAMLAQVLLLCGAVGGGALLLTAVPYMWLVMLFPLVLGGAAGGVGVILHLQCVRTLLIHLRAWSLASSARLIGWSFGISYFSMLFCLFAAVFSDILIIGFILAGLALLVIGGMYMLMLIQIRRLLLKSWRLW